MSRRIRILRNVGLGLAALIVTLVVAAILVVRTDRFREYVKAKIITATEEGTGGRVEIGSFSFDWSNLRATVTGFVIHGNEPAGEAPYLRADRVQIHLRLFTALKRLLDITYLGLDHPAANILVNADGSTNVPQPRQHSASPNTPLETVVDLAVGRFELTSGSITYNSRKQDFDLRGNQLRVQLWFSTLKQQYTGQLSLAPLYVVSGRNTPVNFSITLPVTLGRDRIDFQNAQLTTAASQLVLNGSVENLRNPKTSAHIQGHVALIDLKRAANLELVTNTRGVPASADLDVNATVAGNVINVVGARVTFGGSNIEASGQNSALQFHAQLALGELGRLAKLAVRPEGTVHLNGIAKFESASNYDVNGNVEASGVSFQQGAGRIRNVTLASAAHVTPRRLELNGFRLGVFGGEIAGNAALEDFARYTLQANLRHFDLRRVAREAAERPVLYDGTISGSLTATGDLNAPGTKGLTAQARLGIAPGRQGVPVSAKLFASYRGDIDNLAVTDSYIALPHTRLNLDGSLNHNLTVALTSRDLGDLTPALGSTPPVALAGGQASFTGTVAGRLSSPQVSGHLAVNHFAVEGRQFDALTADVSLSSSKAAISGGSLQRGPMETQFSAAVGLRQWDPAPDQPLSVQASVRNGDLADLLAMAAVPPQGYSGSLSANINVSGTVANPQGNADLAVANGTIQGEPFDAVQARINLADQLVTVPSAYITAGPSRINLTTEFRHPRESFGSGQLSAHIQSTQVDLAQLRSIQQQRPQTAGVLQLDAAITGQLRDSKFLLTTVTGDASGRGLRSEGQTYGDFTAIARTNGQAVTYNATSNFAGSQIRVNGTTQLAEGYPTIADANIGGLPIERVLLLAKRTDIPARGTLAATVHFSGTMDHPEGNLDATVDRGVFHDEPIDRLRARVSYLANRIDVPQLEIQSGPSSLVATARYDHPAGQLESGEVQFHVTNGHIDLARLRNLQKIRPGLAGTLQLSGNGTAEVRTAASIVPRDINLNFAARGIAAQGKNFGDLTLTANTSGGAVHFNLDSNLASASIQGGGTAQLSGDYPLQAQMTFKNVAWTKLQPLLGTGGFDSPDFEASTDGQITVDGPALRLNGIRGRLQLSRVQVSASQPNASVRPAVSIENQGPVVVTLEAGAVKMESLHLAGSQTDIQAAGSVFLTTRVVEGSLKARTDLTLARRFSRDIISSGEVVANTTVRGTLSKPLINGAIELHNASVNYASLPTGISNANGTIQFNGSSATMQNVAGEVGGGRVTLGGFVSFGDALRFAVTANASNVRLRLQPGVSAVADANLRLTGRSESSVLSGTVTVNQVTYAPQSDFGAILSRAAPPVQSASAPAPILDNMRLDLQVRTSSATALQASVAQNLQADANLRIQGSAAQPAVLGRITINEGELLFFGSSYTVNTGTIAFYNPTRIEPVLDLSLETMAKGVDVTLRVTGPIDNMKLSYTSEPPLQFQEIVSLLAASSVPTSDPTLLANQPVQPQQSFQQMGESALVSKALADPVSNRLQRVFGVTQLKIDPTFTGTSDLPQAQLSLQQRVSSHITLTYTTTLDSNDMQIMSGAWAINREWSATATRDQYGIFSVRVLYKRQFR